MLATATPAPAPAPLPPLKPRPDQREQWLAHTAPRTFDAAVGDILEAHRQDGERHDLAVADLRAWAFGSSDGQTAQLAPLLGRRDTGPMALREIAFGQLCTKLGAPAAYLRELPGKLQIACVNHGLVGCEQSATLRVARGEIRAVVSERYAAVDDHDLLELVAEALDHHGLRSAARVRASATGATTLMRITLPTGAVEPVVGDRIEYGIDLSNSELGFRSVGITPLTYRLVCTNGLRAWRSEGTSRYRHVGDPARLRDLLRDAIPVALAQARGDLERWRRSVDVLIDAAADEIDRLRAFGFTQPEVQLVKRELVADTTSPMEEVEARLRSTSATAYAVVNAATAVARTRPSVDRRLDLETATYGLFQQLTR